MSFKNSITNSGYTLILDTHFQHNFALYLIQSNKYYLFPLAPMHTNGLDNTVLTFLNNMKEEKPMIILKNKAYYQMVLQYIKMELLQIAYSHIYEEIEVNY